MPQVILITGAGSGFGLLGAKALAQAGHVVYGGLHSHRQGASDGGNSQIRDGVLDITSKDSIDAAVQKILSETGRLDCVVHNAGHMGMGPAESFSAEQYHQYYEINAVGAHRLNQAVLPLMRKNRQGHIIWVSSSSCRGGCGPLLAPYFAAKAGIFTSGTNHFANAGKPASPEIAAEYMDGPLKGADTIMMKNVGDKFPKDASPQLVADAMIKAVDARVGDKPFRIPVDPF